MSKEMEFFIFLLEQYAFARNSSADVVLKKWDEAGITDTIYNMYEMYHTEYLENAYNDIDKLLESAGTR